MKIKFYTFGCKTNQYETESIKSQVTDLSDQKIELVEHNREADTFVINTCTVTAEADRQCRQLVRKIYRETNTPRVVITGCYANRNPSEIIGLFPGCTLVNNYGKNNIARILNNGKTGSRPLPVPTVISTKLIQDETSGMVGYGSGNDTLPSTLYTARNRMYVKIQDGCNAKCSYCIIPQVRPVMWTKPEPEVITEVTNLVSRGCKEIVLTGIRLGKYGYEKNSTHKNNLLVLLNKLKDIPNLFRIRLSSLEVTEVTDELLLFMQNPANKICHHLHLPLQSGNDRILSLMKRFYDTEYFRQIVTKVRRYLPYCGITTDVMVGFPGETEVEFMPTFNFISELKFSRLHVFPYSPRPGTPAVEYVDPVSETDKKVRKKKLHDLDARLRAQFIQFCQGNTFTLILDETTHSLPRYGYTENYIHLPVTNDVKKDIISVTL